jgi:hypothetical protein
VRVSPPTVSMSNVSMKTIAMAISSLIALLAVAVSLFSVIASDRNQRKTLALNRSLARLTKEVEYRRSQIDGLREDISKFCNLCYKVRSFDDSIKHGLAVDNLKAEAIVDSCEITYNMILMRLNPSNPLQMQLMREIELLRLGNASDWHERRSSVLALARDVFSNLWNSSDLVDAL